MLKYLTQEQRLWIARRSIRVGEAYMFPRFGFNVYSGPSGEESAFIDTNPFTKSLDKQLFLVKEILNGYCRGNFYHRPHHQDFWLSLDELSARGGVEMLFLLLIMYLPFVLYNWWKNRKLAVLKRKWEIAEKRS